MLTACCLNCSPALQGYSEMLHLRGQGGQEEQREGYDKDTLFRHITLLVLLLAACRCCLFISPILLDQHPRQHQHSPASSALTKPGSILYPAMQACLNPPKYLTQSLPMRGQLLYVGALVCGTILDVVLQILGTAAIWGSTDCFGIRRTHQGERETEVESVVFVTDNTCRLVCYVFSVLSAGRYMWRIYKYRMEGHLGSLDWQSSSSSSGNSGNSGSVNRPSSGGKGYDGQYELVQAPGVEVSGPLMKGVVHSFGVSFCSLGEAWRVLCALSRRTEGRVGTGAAGGLEKLATVTVAPIHLSTSASLLAIMSFLLGYVVHIGLRLVLEVLGAAGAVWGISEVLCLRTAENGYWFSVLGAMASLLVLLRLGHRFVVRHYGHMSREGVEGGRELETRERGGHQYEYVQDGGLLGTERDGTKEGRGSGTGTGRRGGGGGCYSGAAGGIGSPTGGLAWRGELYL